MKVALVLPPDERLIYYVQRQPLSENPPLGLAYLAAYIRREGHAVALLDSNSHRFTISQVCDWIRREKPDIVGMTVFTSLAVTCATIARRIKEEISDKIVVVVGGPHVHVLAEDFVASCPHVDFAVRGEGEEVFSNLIATLSHGGDVKQVAGISFVDPGTGKVHSTPNHPFIKNLDNLPLPAYDLLPMDHYVAPQALGGGRPYSTIMTSRGCPFKCEYCSAAVAWGRIQRRRTPLHVIEEIEELAGRYHVKAMRLEDDLFTLKKDWAAQICEEMIKRGLNRIRWEVNIRIDVFDKELLRLMRRAGCVSVAFGVEFGNQRVLDIVSKGFKLDQIKPGVAAIRETGLRSKGFFMIGHPVETPETVEDTIRLANTCGVNYAVFSLVTPFPGTELFRYCEKNGLLVHKNWEHYQFGNTENRPLRIPAIPPEELARLWDRAVRKFYYNPTRILDYIVHHPKLMARLASDKLASIFKH